VVNETPASAMNSCCSGCFGAVAHRPATQITDGVREKFLGKGSYKCNRPSLSHILLAPSHKTLGHNYKELQQIGQGGFGTVYVAVHVYTGESRAVKAISKANMLEDAPMIMDELKLLIDLDHPNIVKLHEFYEESSQMFLVTEMCDAGDFADVCGEEPAIIQNLFRDTVRAVSYCHDRNVAHRDLKFENVLLQNVQQEGRDRIAKVIDFGLSAIMQPFDQRDHWMSDVCGTSYFMAPEVVNNRATYGKKCDNWSLGVMLFIALTGYHPVGKDAASIPRAKLFKRIVKGQVELGVLDAPSFDPEAKALLLGLLQKDVEKRLFLADALNMPYLCTFTERVTSVRHIASTSLSTTMDHLAHFSQLSKFQRAIMMLVAHHTDINKLEKLKTQFHLLDPKNTGTLEKEDLQQGLKSCKLDMTTEQFDELFRNLVFNEEGKVHYTDFIAATLEPQETVKDKMIDQLFNDFDAAQLGVITAKQLEVVLGGSGSSVLKEGQTLNRKQFRALIVKEVADIAEKYSHHYY